MEYKKLFDSIKKTRSQPEEEEVYVSQPEGFIDFEFLNHVYRLKKALYGLKQAPRAWYDKLSSFLIEHGFNKGIIDPTLFTRRHGGDILLVQVYVDDIIFGSTNLDFSKRFANLMKNNFEMSMMGELKFFLGLQVHQSPRGIFISQSQYAIELLKKHGLDECVSMSTPMATERLDADLQGTPTDQTTYRHMIGGLMYLTANRPDIAFATFSSKKQDCIAMSIAEAGYVSLSACCAQVIWMRTQLLDYGFKYNWIPMYCDSKSAIAISCNPVQHSKTKHIDIRFCICNNVVASLIVLLYCVNVCAKTKYLLFMKKQEQGWGSADTPAWMITDEMKLTIALYDVCRVIRFRLHVRQATRLTQPVLSAISRKANEMILQDMIQVMSTLITRVVKEQVAKRKMWHWYRALGSCRRLRACLKILRMLHDLRHEHQVINLLIIFMIVLMENVTLVGRSESNGARLRRKFLRKVRDQGLCICGEERVDSGRKMTKEEGRKDLISNAIYARRGAVVQKRQKIGGLKAYVSRESSSGKVNMMMRISQSKQVTHGHHGRDIFAIDEATVVEDGGMIAMVSISVHQEFSDMGKSAQFQLGIESIKR
ncbi:retrovirus-related pol polyprotein from transposon TNT 1-94 [Tanacetum coccineum]